MFSLSGNPRLGSDLAVDVLKGVGLRKWVAAQIEKRRAELEHQPRAKGLVWRVSVADLVNKITRLFRAAYQPSIETGSAPDKREATAPAHTFKGSLSPHDALKKVNAGLPVTELWLESTDLRFRGVLDLVRRDDSGTAILDFKAGATDPSHINQVLEYSVLWWKLTGDAPTRVLVQYPGSVVSQDISVDDLNEACRSLEDEIHIARASLAQCPAGARLGDYCSWCSVRQLCEAYWVCWSFEERTEKAFVDVQLQVQSVVGESGFTGATLDGVNVAVTYERGVGNELGPFEDGCLLRILGGVWHPDPPHLELKLWTEVFEVDASDDA